MNNTIKSEDNKMSTEFCEKCPHYIEDIHGDLCSYFGLHLQMDEARIQCKKIVEKRNKC